MAGALEDLRVLDLSWGMAGPMTTMFLADNGADVIRIESPQGDPFARQTGYRVWNRGKRSARLDLQSERGTAAVRTAGRDIRCRRRQLLVRDDDTTWYRPRLPRCTQSPSHHVFDHRLRGAPRAP